MSASKFSIYAADCLPTVYRILGRFSSYTHSQHKPSGLIGSTDNDRLMSGIESSLWPSAPKRGGDTVARWGGEVLQGRERFMTSWHKNQEEASGMRGSKRDIWREQGRDELTRSQVVPNWTWRKWQDSPPSPLPSLPLLTAEFHASFPQGVFFCGALLGMPSIFVHMAAPPP